MMQVLVLQIATCSEHCCGVQAALQDLLASYSYRSVTLEQALQTMLKHLANGPIQVSSFIFCRQACDGSVCSAALASACSVH